MVIAHLIATRGQKNPERLLKQCNIKEHAIICNQCDVNNYHEYINENNKKIRVINTTTKGVGVNRNLGIQLNDFSDITIISDDDMEYVNNYNEIISKEYESNKDADIIIFNIDSIGSPLYNRKKNMKSKKIGFFSLMNYGAARITFRTKSIMYNNINFSRIFGGGTYYSCGEDSLFLKNAYDAGLKIYTSPYKIANVYEGNSTWFIGFDEKFFYDKGFFVGKAFRHFKIIFCFYFAYKFSKKSNMSHFKCIQNTLLGLKNSNSYNLYSNIGDKK